MAKQANRPSVILEQARERDRKELTTPQAPWTPNWRQKAPAASGLNLVGRIQSGIKHPMLKINSIIVNRLPSRCETNPAIVPPTMAPQFPMIVALVARLDERSLLSVI